MAKKKQRKSTKKSPSRRKSSSRSKQTVPRHSLPEGFWVQVWAVALLVLALLFVLAWFKTGGPIAEWLHQFGLTVIGYAVYALPPLFVYVAVGIFKSKHNRLPFVVKFASVLLIVWLAGLTGLINHATAESTGGVVGKAMNDGMLSLVNVPVATIIYLLLLVVTILFVLQVTLASFFQSIADLFRVDQTKQPDGVKASKKTDEGLAEKPTKVKKGVKLNAGVPILTANSDAKKVKGNFQKTQADTTHDKQAEPASALLAVSDPNWKAPSFNLLEKNERPADAGDVEQNAEIIQNTLKEFNIDVEMEDANIGPKVTQYTLRPPSGVKLTRITQLETNIALSLAAKSLRIEAPIPGKKAVGIEVPNRRPADVGLRGIMESREWKANNSPLGFAIGKDISGHAIVEKLDEMPHLLIAGQTGAGKSAVVNSIITSLLYRNSPSEMKLILVDPKTVEMSFYDNIPHLLTPIITKPDKTISALKWAVSEMDRRYEQLSEAKVKNIKSYNAKIKKGSHKIPVEDENGNVQQHEDGSMPYIVIVIDEMSNLMMAAKNDVESLIVRLAQMSRAVGIHLVLATQRPDVKVVTGLIKANVPARIALTATNQVDSITVLDQAGAEKLLGKGDMLLKTDATPKPIRVQGAWVSDEEVTSIADYLRMQSPPQYNDEVISQPVQLGGKGGVAFDGDSSEDSMFKDAVQVVIDSRKASTSSLQMRLKIGYSRAARIMAEMEEQGIIGPANGSKPRDVLITSINDLDGSGGAGDEIGEGDL